MELTHDSAMTLVHFMLAEILFLTMNHSTTRIILYIIKVVDNKMLQRILSYCRRLLRGIPEGIPSRKLWSGTSAGCHFYHSKIGAGKHRAQ